jgi:molybdenum cofactor cytidylyltransferase
VPVIDLAKALRIAHPTRLALVGAGGKTTALFKLAAVLPPPVWLSATTHLSIEQAKQADWHVQVRRRIDLVDFVSSKHPGITLFTGYPEGDDRLQGLSPELIGTLHDIADQEGIDLLIEADGSRRLPLKAPAEHEPAIPPWVNQVVVVSGMSAIGKPLNEEYVHRLDRFSHLSGLPAGAPISVEGIARILTHTEGGLKNIPPYAHLSILLNQVDTVELQEQADQLARYLLPHFSQVISASLGKNEIHKVHEQIGGIILAAGESKRLGKPKQLLEWKGEPFIRHVARAALAAGLTPVVVVTGSSAEETSFALQGMPVLEVYNPDWPTGQSSSIKLGIRHIPERNGGAVFLLSDQPQVTSEVIKTLINSHSQRFSLINAPKIDDRRANPVLFDKRVFPDLLKLEGDIGGRALFERIQVDFIPWNDRRLLLDVDTQEDYDNFLKVDDCG